ncbi:MAG: hypothetical protein KBA33_04510 [Cloacibacterium sp.]|jgi:hypothetical protein|nr:hypothetical protein [Cloacibacterium sp.]
MENYTEYNTKQKMRTLFEEIEILGDNDFVREMFLGEMISSIKVPNKGFTYNKEGALVPIETQGEPLFLRVDYLVSIVNISFSFKVFEFKSLLNF